MDLDLRELLAAFTAEADELLAAIEQSVLAAESSGQLTEHVAELFRSAHTLKGASSTIGFTSVAELAHHLEDLIDHRWRQTGRATKDEFSLVLTSVDALREAVRRSLNGEDRLTREDDELCKRFRRTVKGASDGSAPGTANIESDSGSSGEADGSVAPTRLTGQSLRIHAEQLSKMVDLAGEIAVARSRVANMLEGTGSIDVDTLRDAYRDADRLYLDLQEQILKLRMVPISGTFRQLARTVRDVTERTGKRAVLTTSGDEVELDLALVECAREALLHLVRNAADHGLETPEQRVNAGKKPVGQIRLTARCVSGHVEIEVSDDGRGLRRESIGARVLELDPYAVLANISDDELWQYIFLPGFSTAANVTDISGRGVGLDVVRRNVETLRGTIDVSTRAGLGTTFTLRLPLTLAIIQGFSVGVADETCILPAESVIECVELPPSASEVDATSGVFNLRGEPLPYLRLRALFDKPRELGVRETIIVLQHGHERSGLLVELVHGQTQTVVKPLPPMFHGIPGVTASALMGDGSIALILDTHTVLRTTRALARNASTAARGYAPGHTDSANHSVSR